MREKLMQIARTAGDFFSARSLSQIDQKEGHANFVTNVDREVEEYLQQALLALVGKRRPDRCAHLDCGSRGRNHQPDP